MEFLNVITQWRYIEIHLCQIIEQSLSLDFSRSSFQSWYFPNLTKLLVPPSVEDRYSAYVQST